MSHEKLRRSSYFDFNFFSPHQEQHSSPNHTEPTRVTQTPSPLIEELQRERNEIARLKAELMEERAELKAEKLLLKSVRRRAEAEVKSTKISEMKY